MALPPASRQSTIESSARSRGPVEEELDSFGQRVSDSYRLGWMGQVLGAARVEKEAWQQAEVGYDGVLNVPKGYELYASSFAHATTEDETRQIQHEIDLNLAARERRMSLTFGETLGADLVAGVFDPLNAVPIPKLLGVGARVGALKGGAAIGALGGGAAVVAGSLDATATREEMAIGAATSVALGAAFGGVLGRVGSRTRLPMPGGAAPITGKFGLRRAPKAGASTDHKGVDIAYPMRTPIAAAGDGQVKTVKRSAKGGLEVEVDYGGGVTSKYLHLDSAAVRPGQKIVAGQPIARTGASGNVTGPHLHWSVYVDGKPVDPLGRVEVRASSPRSLGNSYDLAQGVSIPDSIVVGGVDMPVHIRDGAGAVSIREGSVTDAIEDIVEGVGNDFGGRGGDEDLIADYLRKGGPITRVSRGKRAIDQRKFAAADRVAAEADPIAAPTDVFIVDPRRQMATGHRVLSLIEELENHPRFNPMKTAGKGWVRDLVDESGVDITAMADRAKARQKGRPLTQGRIMEMLRYRAQTLIDDATDAGDELVGYDEFGKPIIEARAGLVAEAEATARGNWTRKISDDDRLIAAQDRAQARVRLDDGELRPLTPDTPLTVAERRSGAFRITDESPSVGEATTAEAALNRVVIDPGYIYAQFGERPWVGEALPDGKVIVDADIRSPGDWFNFTLNRAIAIAEQGDGVDIPAANARALDELKKGSGAFVPVSGVGKGGDAALLVSPMGQLKRLVPHDADIQRSLYRLAGDGTVLLEANRDGAIAVRGGSVMVRQLGWLRHLGTIRDSIRRSWLEGIGKDATRGRLLTEVSIMTSRATLLGKNTLDGFRLNVGRAIVGFEDDAAGSVLTTAHRKAAAAWDKVMKDVEKAAREVGLFTDSKRIQGLADKAEQAAASLERKLEEMRAKGFAPETLAMMERAAAEASERAAQQRQLADTPLVNNFEPGHFSRMWHKQALVDDEAGVLDALEQAYARAGELEPRLAARRAYQTLIADPEGELHAPGTPGFVKARSIPITNKEAWPWIVQDPETVGLVYLRRMSAAIEMTRMYGDPFGLTEVDRLTTDLLQRGVPEKDVRQAIQIWEDARDRIAGGYHATDPLSFSNRTMRGVRAGTQLMLMGGSLKSQLSDIGRLILTQGLGARFVGGETDADAGILGAFMGMWHGDLNRFFPGGPAKQAGEATDLIVARAAMRLIENDDAYVVTGSTALERGLTSATVPFHVASLLTPLTIMLKELTGLSAAHNLLNDVAKVADGTASNRITARLARMGIDEDGAKLLATMPIEQGESGLNLANLAAWADVEGGLEAAELFNSAIVANVRASVPAPGPLDKPAVADGIFHIDSQRVDHQAKIDAVSERVILLRQQMGRVYDLPDGSAEKEAVIDALREASGELMHLKRNRGRAGRKDLPFASAPFVLRGYGLGAGKALHGLMSGTDRNRLGGVIALLAMGYASWYWKMNGNVDEVPWTERIGHAFDASGIPAWLGDFAKGIDTAIDADAIPWNRERDPDGEALWDEAGGVTASAAAVQRLVAPFTAETDDEQAHAARQAIPLNNAVWLKWAFDLLEDGIDGEDDGSAPTLGQRERAGDRALTALGGDPGDGELPAPEGNGIDYGLLPPKAAPAPVSAVLVDEIEIPGAIDPVELLDDIDLLLEVYPADRAAKLKRKATKAARAKKPRQRAAVRDRTNF